MGRGLHCEFGFEPINLNTGNFYLDRTDVSITDVDGKFEITRAYNSKAVGINSLFGRGWSFAFNEQLSSDEDQNLYYTVQMVLFLSLRRMVINIVLQAVMTSLSK